MCHRTDITASGAAPYSKNRLEIGIRNGYGTASSLVHRFEALGLLRETTGQQRNRRYRYEPYLKLFPRA